MQLNKNFTRMSFSKASPDVRESNLSLFFYIECVKGKGKKVKK